MKRHDEPTPLWTRQQELTQATHADPGGATRSWGDPLPERLYLDRVPPELREAFEAASADANLAPEIRLMRAVLSLLSQDVHANSVGMTRVLGALIRAIDSHSKQVGSSDIVEQILLYAG